MNALKLIITRDGTGEILHDQFVPEDALFYVSDFDAYFGGVLARIDVPPEDVSGHSVEMELYEEDDETGETTRVESALIQLDGSIEESESLDAVRDQADAWFDMEGNEEYDEMEDEQDELRRIERDEAAGIYETDED